MTASDWTMQRLADLLDAPVDRPMIQETTALGAAYLAGLGAGIYPEPEKFADNWRLEHRFKPNMSEITRTRKLAGWSQAVKGCSQAIRVKVDLTNSVAFYPVRAIFLRYRK